MFYKQGIVSLLLIVVMLVALALPLLAQDDLDRAHWCEGVTIRFFAASG